MAAHILIPLIDRFIGGHAADEGDAASPGSGGASPYLGLRLT
ncbi:MAG TPA: hypothetical protein VK775_21620 [Chthoniobacterales bacterium]|nr:hypothetical protein [Chthoniobacterales bacterium]